MGWKLTKTYLRHFFIVVIVFIASLNTSHAGGFPVRPGSLLLSPSINYFFANKGWDSLGVKNPFNKNGHFTSVSVSLYAEYGISKRFTFIALLPYVTNNYQQDDFKSLSSGVTDLETGLRYYIANINYIYYFSVQATAITPLYTNLNLGYKENGAELKFSFAGSGHLFRKNCYFTVENGLRQYFGSTGPAQDRYSGTFGMTLDKKFKQQFSVSLGGFYSTSSFTKFSPTQYQANKNFAFNQVSLSYGYSFTKQFSMFINGGKFISGRNTGAGSSGSVSFIYRVKRL